MKQIHTGKQKMEMKQTGLRIPKDIYDKVVSIGKDELFTNNATASIVYVLKKGLEKIEQEKKEANESNGI
jgi:hypothetical protein